MRKIESMRYFNESNNNLAIHQDKGKKKEANVSKQDRVAANYGKLDERKGEEI